MQKTIKLIYVIMILSIAMAASPAFARSFRFEMYANGEDVILGLESEAPLEETVLNIGGGFVFSGEDYTIGDLHFALKS